MGRHEAVEHHLIVASGAIHTECSCGRLFIGWPEQRVKDWAGHASAETEALALAVVRHRRRQTVRALVRWARWHRWLRLHGIPVPTFTRPEH